MRMSDVELADVAGHYCSAIAIFRDRYQLVLGGMHQAARILEICCGEGALSAWLARTSGVQVLGIDADGSAIECACERYRNVPNLRFERQDVMGMAIWTPPRARSAVCSGIVDVVSSSMSHSDNIAYRQAEMSRARTVAKFLMWDIVNSAVLYAKRRRRYRFDPRFAGLNLGCGVWTPPNWLGVDGGVYLMMRYLPNPLIAMLQRSRFFANAGNHEVIEYLMHPSSRTIIHWDTAHGLPFDDGTVPAIYSSHFFEHLSHEDGLALMRECFRVLRPEGVIRFCLPDLSTDVADMKAAIAKYERGDSSAIQTWVTFGHWSGYTDVFTPHKHMYDLAGLRRSLESVGFINVTPCSYREGQIADAGLLDRKPTVSFHAEASKPC